MVCPQRSRPSISSPSELASARHELVFGRRVSTPDNDTPLPSSSLSDSICESIGEKMVGGSTPPPSTTSDPTAFVIAVRSPETEHSSAEQKACVMVEPEEGKFCRICQLNAEQHWGANASEVIVLECGCKGRLATAHRRCAEAWFRVKGNRNCEICGDNAKNVVGENDSSFLEEWHGTTLIGGSIRSSTQRESCWKRLHFCKFLLAFVVIGFIMSWMFRIDML